MSFPKKLRHSIASVATIALGLIAMPFVILILAIFNRSLLKQFLSKDNSISLAGNAHRDRLQFDRVPTTPAILAKERVAREIKHMVETKNWRGISEQLRVWDQDRTTCDAGYSLAEIGMRALLHEIAHDPAHLENCNPEGTTIFSEQTAKQFETLAASHPGSHPLLAAAVQIRTGQAWGARGNSYAGEVSQNAWETVTKHMERAAWLLEETDPLEMNSPLLAMARYHLLPFLANASTVEQKFYEEWSDLDPTNMTPHAEHANMMLGRWFGAGRSIEVEAQKAVLRTSPYTGDAAYFIIYYSLFDYPDVDLSDMDTDQFAKGADEFLTMRKSDPSIVAKFATQIGWWANSSVIGHLPSHRKQQEQRISDAMAPLRTELLRKHLTAIHPFSWDGGIQTARDELSEAFQAELAEGADLVIDERGVTVTYPDQGMAGAIPAE